ncbi:chromosome segregation protein SMC [candidate division KSB1 bacterium]|nr:MAG: chromosome segregation protein SMC [candidate division KSB1 bacterium]
MQLLSLNISGFKSFAKPTRLEFAQGITCVVGPNGCGKSNVVDSLRWVLGEQRSSVLRSDRMENVIFNGTAVRKPAGMAEVSITLDNKQGILGVPYAEVEIARRLYRDGTSEYLLNSKECRLKDITDILHDSGMGPNLYTILELKMVEDILREDGEGRRTLFEEAAGVAKYKLRRRQALQKLRQTEDDLVRLADIVGEVERQVSSLKRQAMRARRYEELSAQLRALDAALVYREYLRLKNELTPLETAVKASSASTDAAKSAIRLEESNLLELRTSEVDADKETRSLRQLLSNIVNEISALEAEEAGLRAREQAARQTLERTQREQQLLNEKRMLLDTRCSELALAMSECERELQSAENRVTERDDALKEAEAGLLEAESRVHSHQNLIHGFRQQVLERQQQVSRIALNHAGYAGRKEMLERELEASATERTAILENLEEAKRQIAVLYGEEAELRKQEGDIVSQIQIKNEEMNSLDEKTRALSALIESIASKLDLLHTLEEKGPRAHTAIRALKAHPVDGLLALLGDTVDVQEIYRRAFQAALGPAAYYYLTESVDAALSAMEVLRQEKAGQTTFLPVSVVESEQNETVNPPEDTYGSALGLLNGHPQNSVLKSFLARVVIVKDWESALGHFEWARQNHCTLVTLDGQWIGARGMKGGSEETGLPVDLGLSKQVAELTDKLTLTQQENESARTEIRGLRNTLSRVEQDQADVRRKLDSTAGRRMQCREQQVMLETRLTTLEERRSSAAAQIAGLETDMAECNQQLLLARAELEAAEHQVHNAETSGSELSRLLNESQLIVSQERERKHERERERDAVKHRLELLRADHDRLQQNLAEIAQDLEQSLKNAENAQQELSDAEVRLREIDALSIEKYRARDAAGETVDKATSRLDEIRNQIAEYEERLRQLRDSHAGELEGERKIELEVARLSGELDALVSNAKTQYGYELESDRFAEEHPAILETEATPELLLECRHKIERLGPVNSLAIEEYAQENARLDTMLRQRDDLLKAKQTLEETIARINETAQARFLHTFEAVRTHFQRLFQEFFPAGEADLILSGQDLLEADITLWANPSGKRLKSLSLMSGGEKTMTAIALLFALYQVKPSPFCVFDEVDAPLDDANIERFNHVIRMHSQSTQFILITHNRRTMEIADNLYGVTMEEEGISKLVSVRLLSSVA